MLLYLDTKRAPNPRKMRIYLAEKGLDLPIKQLDLRAGEQRTPEFLKKNPFAGVPILELDDGTIIAESLAIMEYLEEIYPNPPLIGADPVTRALVRMWERRIEIGVYLPASRMVLSKGEVSEHARKTLVARLALVNDGLQGREWVAGHFSIADIMLLIGLDTAHHGGQFTLEPAWTNVGRWYERMKARPSASV
ncbi:MAG TPA: glutathione S-transferase family protein [Candidatus Binatia bacterium]|nr:glutathione S-transferase family protein [Candidatus Binatia bacterium]